MAIPRLCSIPDCGKRVVCRGLCDMHYTRLKRHGDAIFIKTAPEGDGLAFLSSLIGHKGEDCVNWPFSRSAQGYGQTYYRGKVVQTHRLICVWVHGDPPAPRLQAAHRCGNTSCVNPNHLRWRTPAENIAEKQDHGTKLFGAMLPSAKLTDESVKQIIGLNGRATQRRAAMLYGVSSPTIARIWKNKTWRHIPRPTVCD